jgi:hypothetical protein
MERCMLNDGQSKADAEVAKELLATGSDDCAALHASTIGKIDAARGVIAAWALLPSFLDEQRTGPKPDTSGGQQMAKRRLRDADAWAVAVVLSRAAPKALSLNKLARYIAEDREYPQRAARQSLQGRLLPAMQSYGLVHYVKNGSGFNISATQRLLVFVEDRYLPALRHDGWMHYFDLDGVGEEHEES